MSVYVDAVKWYPTESIQPAARKHGNLWAHLWADTREELDSVAEEIGLNPGWLQVGHFPHYDVTPHTRGRAIATGRVIVRELRDWMREKRAEIAPVV